MIDRKQTTRPPRRGTALVEFVFAIPLLALVIGLTFFFGSVLVNQQRVKVATRYTSWNRPAAQAEHLNELFFYNRAEGIGHSSGGGPEDALVELVEAAGTFGSQAGMLAEAAVLRRWPRGRDIHFAASFPLDVDLWRRLSLVGSGDDDYEGEHRSGRIRGRLSRDGVEWRRPQAGLRSAVREQFLTEIDSLLETTPDPGAGLAEEIRRIYLHGW